MATSEPALNTVQAAKELGITTRAVYGLIDAGRLPAFRRGRQIYIALSAVDALRDTAAAEADAVRDREGEKARALRFAAEATTRVQTSIRARDVAIAWAAKDHGASLRDLAEATGLPPMTIKRIIDRLA
jgi:excisionase family DNA binding protein